MAEMLSAIVHDKLPVRLLDGDDGKTVIWFGTLVEFEQANGLDDAECACIRTDLFCDGRYVTGGGAAQAYVLEVDGRFALVVIGAADHSARRYEHAIQAISIATLLCAKAPRRFAAVITDLHTGEAWHYSPPSFHVQSKQSAA